MTDEQALPSNTTFALVDLSLFSSRIDTFRLIEQWLFTTVDSPVETASLVGDGIPIEYAKHVVGAIYESVKGMRVDHENDLEKVLAEIVRHSVESAAEPPK